MDDMNGYEIIAQSYEKLLERKPEMDPAEKENINRTIKSLRLIADKTEDEINELFGTGAFNEICKGYFRKAMTNCKLDDKTIAAVMDELKWLLDTMPVQDARKC